LPTGESFPLLNQVLKQYFFTQIQLDCSPAYRPEKLVLDFRFRELIFQKTAQDHSSGQLNPGSTQERPFLLGVSETLGIKKNRFSRATPYSNKGLINGY
jgi:hypothetical protein